MSDGQQTETRTRLKTEGSKAGIDKLVKEVDILRVLTGPVTKLKPGQLNPVMEKLFGL